MTLGRDKGQRGRWPAWQALDPPVMSLSAQGGKSSMSSTEPVHTEGETHPWKVNVPDHPLRADSPEYVAARKQMIEIAAQAPGLIYGEAPYQDHHGGALWMKDAQGWFLVRNLAGIEWSAQFSADPAKVDLLRQNAKRLYDLLAPEIKQQLDPGGLLDRLDLQRWRPAPAQLPHWLSAGRQHSVRQHSIERHKHSIGRDRHAGRRDRHAGRRQCHAGRRQCHAGRRQCTEPESERGSEHGPGTRRGASLSHTDCRHSALQI